MKKQFALIAVTLSALAAGAAAQAAQPTPLSTLTRAQVQADLAAWRAAGLEDATRGEQTPDVYSTSYRSKVATYQEQAAQQQPNRTAAAK